MHQVALQTESCSKTKRVARNMESCRKVSEQLVERPMRSNKIKHSFNRPQPCHSCQQNLAFCADALRPSRNDSSCRKRCVTSSERLRRSPVRTSLSISAKFEWCGRTCRVSCCSLDKSAQRHETVSIATAPNSSQQRIP